MRKEGGGDNMTLRKRLHLWLYGCEFRNVCKLYQAGSWYCDDAQGAHCGMKRRLEERRWQK